MHGLKADHINHLRHLCGEKVVRVGVGEHQLQFSTHPGRAGAIAVEGRCELIDPTRNVIDVWEPGRRSREFRFLDLLGKTIMNVRIDTPKSFVAIFSDEWSLRFVDDSEQYESFSVGSLFV